MAKKTNRTDVHYFLGNAHGSILTAIQKTKDQMSIGAIAGDAGDEILGELEYLAERIAATHKNIQVAIASHERNGTLR